ncbi:hypothetical protein CVCC1112_2573 [Paenarthrobacter nicotinovorans]|nr:hypothetical protein CVCC1112_2573 [Paenarthrobacter nicotinovorans]
MVPFWHGVAIPLIALIPFAANEIWLSRKVRKPSGGKTP